jgi:ABC-2 type transport system permease protein
MNTQSNVVPESSLRSQTLVAPGIKPSQQLYWSVRRELWESRWIYIAPVAVGALYLLAFLIGSMMHLLDKIREGPNSAQLLESIERPYNVAALLIMGSTFIIALFYCLDALYSERRDRSILFWKSLPVSDLTTVLAKASIPLVILPLLTFAVTVATHWIMLLLSSGILLARGLGVAILWNHLPLFEMWVGLLYHLVAIHGLWYAPIYGWLLMVSAWATRVPALWAALPPLAIGFAEKIAFNTSYFGALLGHRIGGDVEGGKLMAANTTMHPLMQLEPVRFLLSPGLWIGFLVTALFLAAAIRLRHYRGPI